MNPLYTEDIEKILAIKRRVNVGVPVATIDVSYLCDLSASLLLRLDKIEAEKQESQAENKPAKQPEQPEQQETNAN